MPQLPQRHLSHHRQATQLSLMQVGKKVVHHAMRHQDAYPGFHDFASVVQEPS